MSPDPITLAALATVGGSMLSAGGGLASSEAAAGGHEFNAGMAARDGALARIAARTEEERLRRSAERLKGTQRAAIAGAGGTATGSALQLILETAQEEELEALSIRFSGSEAEASAQAQAAMDRINARSTRTIGRISAGASLLNGGSNAGMMLGG